MRVSSVARSSAIIIIAMLSISLTASFITIRPVWALNSFSDGFESGSFSAWTGTAARAAGDSCTIGNAITFRGGYSGKFTTIGNGASTEYADCYVAINKSNLVYARGYFYFGSNALPLDDASDRFTIIQLGWTKGDRSGSVQVEKSSGVPQWALRIYVGAIVTTYRSATPVPLTQSWWEVQFMEKVDATSGEVHLWVNGSEIISRTGLNTTTMGQINKVHFGSAYTVNIQHNVTIYADNCKVSDSYIQPEPPGQNPTTWNLSVSSAHGSPNPNAGDHLYNDGSSVTCSVNSPVTEGSTSYNCTGWTGTGSVQASGSSTSVTFSITQNSTINWTWQVMSLPPSNQDGCVLSLPTAYVQMQVSNGTLSYFDTLLSNVPPGYDVTNGSYLGWCVDLRYNIIRSPYIHNVILYSSCDPPAALMNQRWDMVNYILNHKQGSATDIQQAISYFVKMNGQAQGWRSGYTPTAEAQAMVNDALANGTGYLPTPSPPKVIAVICVPQEATQVTIIEVRAHPHEVIVPQLFVSPPVTKFLGPCLVSTAFSIDVSLWNIGLSGQDVYAFDFFIDWSTIPAGYISLVNATAHSPWVNSLIIANSNVTADNLPITNWHLAITAVSPSTGLTDVNQSVLTLIFHIDKDVCFPNSILGTFALLNVKMSGDGTKVVPITDMEVDNGVYEQISVQPDIELATTDAAYNATTRTITEKCNSHTFDIEVDLTDVTNAYGFAFTLTYDPQELETDAQHVTFKAAFPPPYEILMVHQDTGSIYIKLVRPSEKPAVCGALVPAVDIVFHTIDTKDFASGKPLLPTTDKSTISITQADIYAKCPDPVTYTSTATTTLWNSGNSTWATSPTGTFNGNTGKATDNCSDLFLTVGNTAQPTYPADGAAVGITVPGYGYVQYWGYNWPGSNHLYAYFNGTMWLDATNLDGVGNFTVAFNSLGGTGGGLFTFNIPFANIAGYMGQPIGQPNLALQFYWHTSASGGYTTSETSGDYYTQQNLVTIGPCINYYFTPSKYDLNLDCSVDVQDLMVLLPYYGTNGLPLGGYGDLVLLNLSVDIFDFVAIAKHLGPVDP